MKLSRGRFVACPGAGEMPARQGPVGPIEIHACGDLAICPRCGRWYRVRGDGRIRAHRVPPSVIIPAIGGARYTSGKIKSRRC